MISRDVHDECVADAPAGPQARFACNNSAQQFIRVQATLHQQFRTTLSNQLDRLGESGEQLLKPDRRETYIELLAASKNLKKLTVQTEPVAEPPSQLA